MKKTNKTITENINALVTKLITAEDSNQKRLIAKTIFEIAYKHNIYPASIHEVYLARGRGEFSGFSVPAINLRTMTYDMARAIFRVAKRNDCAAFIFEIAKSEMGYTNQSPIEFTSVILAAAIKENYSGPVFIQSDHTQVNYKRYSENPKTEINTLKKFIKEVIDAGFYNIDIDSSTIVDLSKRKINDQQYPNYLVCAELTKFIRENQPKATTISVGGEIGEVGSKNSTPEELRAFMNGLNKYLGKNIGISKISIQTGTSHGGIMLPDGTIAKVNLDFETLKNLSTLARKEYGLAGAVQHGASTLPSDMFHKFPEVDTAEVHLATEFQNMILDSKHFPKGLKRKMYEWIRTHMNSERKSNESDEQFYYKNRKKALGPFKKEIMGLPQKTRDAIAKELEKKIEFLFKQLNAQNNTKIVKKYIKQTRTVIRMKKSQIFAIDSEGAD